MLKKNNCTAIRGNLIVLASRDKQKPSDFPGLFVDEWLLSLVLFKNLGELENWFGALTNYALNPPQKVFVLGMMKPFYIHWAEKIHACFRKEKRLNGKTSKHLADTTTNSELAEKLSKGCAFAIYVGHGRSRGWSGYRGFRWEHMEKNIQHSPVGTLVSFSCNGLKYDRSSFIPFGLRWVVSGRACTSLTSCGSLKIRPLEKIATTFMECISRTGVLRVDEYLFDINEKLRQMNDPDVVTNWQQFRLIGNPIQMME